MITESAFWSNIAFSTLISSLVSAAIQVFFKAQLDKRLESHKGRLNAENLREIEHIRAENARELEGIRGESIIAAERFKKSYGLLVERQAEAVEAIYKNLTDVHLALLRLVSPGRFGGEPSDAELFKTLHETRWAGMDHFRAKRLFLSAALGAEIDALYNKIGENEMSFRFKVGLTENNILNAEEQQRIFTVANIEMTATLREIETQFRHIPQGGSI